MNSSPDSHQPFAGKTFIVVALIVLVAAMTALRVANLDADPPSWYIPIDHGLQVDEGYKTLDPRNLSLYGDTHWNPHDEYPGWLRGSPLTQWPYYFAFKTFGTSIETARAVVATAYTAFLLLAFWLMYRRYGQRLAFTGLLLLGMAPGLYQFSRSAIFEGPIVIAFYSCLLLWLHLKRSQTNASALIGTAIAGGVAALFIKASSLLYVMPALLLLILVELSAQKSIRRGLLIALPFALALTGSAIWISRHLWLSKLDVTVLTQFWMHFLTNPIPVLAPMLLTGATLTLLFAVRTDIRWLLNNPYRLVLAGIMIGSPLLLSLFKYQPPRFFVPMVPAAILLILEGLRWTPKAPPYANQYSPYLRYPLEIILIICLTMWGMRDLNEAVLVYLPAFAGEDPGVSAPSLLKLLVIAAPICIFFYYSRASERITPTIFRKAVATCIVIATIPAIAHTYRIVTQPEYRIREIANKLQEIVPTGGSIAGIIAPLFTTDTQIKPLYVDSKWLNQAYRFPQLKPDFFIAGEFKSDRETLAELKSMQDVAVGEPIYLGDYFLGPMYLYPLAYPSLSPDADGAQEISPVSNP